MESEQAEERGMPIMVMKDEEWVDIQPSGSKERQACVRGEVCMQGH